jgi:ribose/xylose/arabinose/galactoside ABC-type transport system permease subunit
MSEVTGLNLQRPAQPVVNPFVRYLRAQLQKRDVQRLIANVLLILIIGTYVQLNTTGLFWTVPNWEAISVQIAVVTLCAVAMTPVMIAGHIDVSVAGTVVLGGVVAGLLINDGVPVWLAFGCAMLVGGGVGLLNSWLVLSLGITSMIATIGTLYATQGVANILTNGLPVGGLPSSFLYVGQGSIFTVPVALPMILIVVGLFAALQSFTLFGRWVVATGSNRRAAYLNGVNVTMTTVGCFVLSGVVAGWGGVVYSSRLGNPIPAVDQTLFFSVVVAIVLGGTSLFGGEGSVLGTFSGAVLLGTVNNGLNLLGISTYYYYIFLGVLLVGSVGFDTVLRRESVYRLRRRVLQRSSRPASEE